MATAVSSSSHHYYQQPEQQQHRENDNNSNNNKAAMYDDPRYRCCCGVHVQKAARIIAIVGITLSALALAGSVLGTVSSSSSSSDVPLSEKNPVYGIVGNTIY